MFSGLGKKHCPSPSDSLRRTCNMASKLAIDPNKVAAMAEIRKALRAIPKEDLATFPLSVGAVSVLLDKDPKTLHAARTTRDELLETKKPIHPLWLESIPYAGTANAATYMALDLVEYLDRLALAPTLKPWEQKLPASYPSLKMPRSFLGFQSWLARAGATELWPFAIQRNGRPMDLIAAILMDGVGDEARWMTIREFSELAADTASREFHEDQRAELGSAPGSQLKREGAQPTDSRDRWSEPGGPI